jgi:hypothetical protein
MTQLKRRGRFLVASGILTMAGQAVTFRVDRGRMAAGSGTFTRTGTAVGLRASRRVVAASRAVLTTGMSVTLVLMTQRRLTAASGAFVRSGQAVTLRVSRTTLVAGAGSFSKVGSAVGLRKTKRIVASSRAFTTTGTVATLVFAGQQRLTAAAGTFLKTGQAVTLRIGRGTLSAGAGVFTRTGSTAALRATRRLTAASRAFIRTGSPATLTAAVTGSCLRTINVSTYSGLTTALAAALPGDCIMLTAGTYQLSANLLLTRPGTAGSPIVIQGVGNTTVINVNLQQVLISASYVQLRRLRLTNFNTVGLRLNGVTGVVLDTVQIDHTKQEAMAIKQGSHHNIIQNCTFFDTGYYIPNYGEAIYIGNSGDPGYPLDFGVTDNQILTNHFGPNVRAEAIDLKEGADRTIIRGNFISGIGAVFYAGTKTLVAVLGNDTIIDNNYMEYGAPMAVTLKAPTTRLLAGNIATLNQIDLRDQFQAQRGTETPYGFQFQAGTTNPAGAIIYCNNTMITGLLSNRACTP